MGDILAGLVEIFFEVLLEVFFELFADVFSDFKRDVLTHTSPSEFTSSDEIISLDIFKPSKGDISE